MAKILIVDDDAQLRHSFNRLLSEEGHEVVTASSGETAITSVEGDIPDLVILDIRLPGMTGLETLERLRKLESRLPVIIMTAYGTTDTAITATRMGAFDYVLKPFKVPGMLKLIGEALEAGRMMRSRVEMDSMAKPGKADALVGKSKVMQEVYKSIGRAAATDATVLIQGESGTGKELAARAVYQYGARSDKPFVIINCVAIPETLLESELFGYEKGAFTGAVSRRLGKVELARGGTVFLDEIGDMPTSIQAKILRLLQEKTIERIGGRGEPVSVDTRIIAATKENLEAAVEQGRFREDLYYRLKVVIIEMPPLREHLDDIPLLVDNFLAKYSMEMGIVNPGVNPETIKTIQQLTWPGNVRELANTLQKALIFSRGYPIRPEDIVPSLDPQTALQDADDGTVKEVIRRWIRKGLMTGSGDNMFDAFMDYFGSALVSEALKISAGNRTRASKLLGITRPTLQSKIEKYNLKIEAAVSKD